MAREWTGAQTGVNEKSQTRTELPPLFRVLMHNDDYTTMDFVVEVLQKVFHKSATEANRIMLHIHHKGVGVCGVFPYEVAETKIAQVHNLARQTGFPLRCSLEEA
ncbi:ATP-dependent Clp protease adaptor protein ClpS [Geothermobacter ehrlichii]|uniref:ATP-dependent Clp protease adapter protein ClpS n=1 Tax=Geothermobacter ehrlichii TaxID=213224 RepID=A0A5D3WH41_9BACT|nr:ATP-dependent Clp protease adapter ClpS [Geothermobacter ehrlichii]TYO97093.1 ATP-dependent Clp protease adaptor protein ClpS [Geothermobacter ehrlichii]